MKTKNIIPKILLCLFFLWLIISLARTAYNFSKLATEERQWYNLTDDQKRTKQFGDMYTFLKFINTHTDQKSNILFFTDNEKFYFFSRYYLYPSTRTGKYDAYLWNKKNISYDYYIVYPVNHKKLVKEAMDKKELKTYKKIATYHGQSGEIGLIYKK